MPDIIVVDMNAERLESFGFATTRCGVVQDYTTAQMRGEFASMEYPLYFVSPANSLGYMNGGIDAAYMSMFGAQIEQRVRERIATIGDGHLPVGSAFVTQVSATGRHDPDHENYLITAPTMISPGDVSGTRNAYHATLAAIRVWPRVGTLIIPPMCCGYGCMDPCESARQMEEAIRDSGYTIGGSTEK